MAEQSLADLLFMPEDLSSRNTQKLLAVQGQERHPLLEGLKDYSFKGSFSLSTAVKFYKDNPVEVLGTHSSGQPFLAIRQLGQGKIINFSMQLSGGPNYPGLSDPGVQKLILNSLSWAN